MTIKITQFSTSDYHESDDKPTVAASIHFTCASHAEALAAYTLLAGGAAKGWNLSGEGSAQDDKPASKPTKVPPVAAVVTKPIVEKPKAEPAPEPVEEEDEDDGDDEDDAEEAPPAKTSIKITGEDIKALKDVKKLRDVLTYLINTKSIKTKKGLTATCNAIKDKVPALARIEDLEDRVNNAVEILDPSMK
jgi:hypothetical protein